MEHGTSNANAPFAGLHSTPRNEKKADKLVELETRIAGAGRVEGIPRYFGFLKSGESDQAHGAAARRRASYGFEKPKQVTVTDFGR